jgi:hypothetical protein
MPDGFPMPMMGGLGGPMAPGRMASPETVMRPMPGQVEGRTVMNSPLAERLGGPLQQMQQLQQQSRMAGIARTMIDTLSKSFVDSNPKLASELQIMSAKLLKTLPPQPAPPTTPTAVQGVAGQLPMGGPGGPVGQMPPPAVGGTALSGLGQGM